MGHAWGIKNQLAGIIREVSEAFGRLNVTVELGDGRLVVATEEIPYGTARPDWKEGDPVALEFYSTDVALKK